METETKVIYHGTTVADSSMPNPPPYTSYPPQGSGMFVVPPTAIIHTTSPAVVVTQQVGPQPIYIVCRSCNAEIVSRVEKLSSTKTHLFALGLCLLGCWCCVCIPYCSDSCLNVNHYCPNCNAYIGMYQQ